MYGDDYQYASSRLAGTVVRVGEEPVIVDDVYPDLNVIVAKLSDVGSFFKVKLSELNLVPVQLGFANCHQTVSYLSRRPMRRDWKQGLRLGNFLSLYGVEAGHVPPQILGQVIKGEYPSLEECKKILGNNVGIEAMAWARNWALTRDGKVLYKGQGKVGGVNKFGEIMLTDEHMHLRECLLETL